MSTIHDWAREWGIPIIAVNQLLQRLGVGYDTPQRGTEGMSESAVQSRVRLDAAQRGILLWRNNKGAYQDERGNFVRYGLCNDTKKLSDSIRSADLIGICPVEVTSTMVGHILGQFVSVEVKEGGWKFTGTEHELAQRKWAELIISRGGRAVFATGPGAI